MNVPVVCMMGVCTGFPARESPTLGCFVGHKQAGEVYLRKRKSRTMYGLNAMHYLYIKIRKNKTWGSVTVKMHLPLIEVNRVDRVQPWLNPAANSLIDGLSITAAKLSPQGKKQIAARDNKGGSVLMCKYVHLQIETTTKSTDAFSAAI